MIINTFLLKASDYAEKLYCVLKKKFFHINYIDEYFDIISLV